MHEAAFVVRLYLLAAQFGQTVFAVAVHAVVSDVPGWQVLQVVQLSAPAADQVPAAQLLQFVFVRFVQEAARYLPAAQLLEAQAEHTVLAVGEQADAW